MQELFNHVYSLLEEGKPIPPDLKSQAINHGIRVDMVEETVLALCEEEDEGEDFDE